MCILNSIQGGRQCFFTVRKDPIRRLENTSVAGTPCTPFVVVLYIAHAQEIVSRTRCSVRFSHCTYVGTYTFLTAFFLVNVRTQRGVVLYCIYFVLIDIIYNKIGKNRYWGHIVLKVSAHVHFVGIRTCVQLF